MIEKEFDVSGAITFWSLQPTSFDAVRRALDAAGFGCCMPNPRTDRSALDNGIDAVYGTKDKIKVSRKRPKTNGIEVVNIERDECRNGYVLNFGAKVVDGRVHVDTGYADEYRLTEEYLKSKAVLTTAAVGQALTEVIARMDGMKGFDRSGVYYVPEHWLEQWKEVGDAIEACQKGNRVTTVRTVMDAGTARAIRDALTKEVQEKAGQLLDDVSKGTLNDGQLHARAEQAQGLVDRVSLYGAILSEGLEGLKNVAALAQGAAAAAVMQDFASVGVCV